MAARESPGPNIWVALRWILIGAVVWVVGDLFGLWDSLLAPLTTSASGKDDNPGDGSGNYPDSADDNSGALFSDDGLLGKLLDPFDIF